MVPERERVPEPKPGLFGWIPSMIKTSNSEFINKCGLDAYFFLRYLRMLLKIFLPIAILLIPILLPVNRVGIQNPDTGGLDLYSISNINAAHTNRLGVHLVAAICVIAYVCIVMYFELKGYIRMRQAYLTSPQHRIRASATTVLVTNIPKKWLSREALDGLYDVFPGGIRNIWINRNFDELDDLVNKRDNIAKNLENLYANLIEKSQKRYEEKCEKEHRTSEDRPGLSVGNPHQVAETLEEALGRNEHEPSEGEEEVIDIPGSTEGPGTFTSIANRANSIIKKVNPLAAWQDRENARRAAAERRRARSRSRGASDDTARELNPRGREEMEKEPDPTPEVKNRSILTTLKGWFVNSLEDELPTPEQFIEMTQTATARRKKIFSELDPEWAKWTKEDDRDTTHQHAKAALNWIPYVGVKLDAIDFDTVRLAAYNELIEKLQNDVERFPMMNSAFIQFNNQVAAHMACQAVNHHSPLNMAPRVVEVSPDDVRWDNLSLTWWLRYIRTTATMLFIVAIIIAWLIPTALSGALSQLASLRYSVSFLHWLIPVSGQVIGVIQGVLAPLVISIFLVLAPIVIRAITGIQGHTTGTQAEMSIQNYYFSFLYIQLFLIVTISSALGTVYTQLKSNPASVPEVLAKYIPRASNYFFSYIILQALSVSAGTLLQAVNLLINYVWGKIVDKSPRDFFERVTSLPNIQWGTFFPIYTNFACIGK
jgi:calcium permeable stress-gated cation channel